jgi:hypothetical protein
MATLTGLTIVTTNGNLTLPSGTSANRPSLQSNTAIRWTNTGSQTYSVLQGSGGTVGNTSWTCPTGVTSIEVLVIAGGGQGGAIAAGGAGGLIYNSNLPVVPGTAYTVTVGAGGSTSPGANAGQNGSNSVFGALTAIGGGGGAGNSYNGSSGGSGGGGGGDNGTNGTAGAGTPGQGHAGGTALTTGTQFGGGGGGGAGDAGKNASGTTTAGRGGDGLNFSISGTPTWYAAGGGGGAYLSGGTGTRGVGGSGIGGNGGQNGTNATNGTASTGSGGGGNGLNNTGNLQGSAGTGGSGVVIIRFTLETATTQPFGQTRFNTTSNTLETFTTKNNWNGSNGAILVLDPGDAACYPGSGSTLTDLSGLGNNATMVTSPTYNAGNGGYFTFNGTSQYLRVPISDSMNTCQTGITMISWIYPTAWNSGMAWNNHIQGATTLGPVSGAIQNLGASGNLNIQARVNNTCCQTLSMSATASLNTWIQYVSIWDGGCLRVYMNGVLQNIGQPVYGTLQMINDMFFGANADSFRIDGSTLVNMYTGRLGWTAIYNRGLTADEVNLNFQTYRSRYGI